MFSEHCLIFVLDLTLHLDLLGLDGLLLVSAQRGLNNLQCVYHMQSSAPAKCQLSFSFARLRLVLFPSQALTGIQVTRDVIRDGNLRLIFIWSPEVNITNINQLFQVLKVLE